MLKGTRDPHPEAELPCPAETRQQVRVKALRDALRVVEGQLDEGAEEDYERGVNAGVMRGSRAIRRLLAVEDPSAPPANEEAP